MKWAMLGRELGLRGNIQLHIEQGGRQVLIGTDRCMLGRVLKLMSNARPEIA